MHIRPAALLASAALVVLLAACETVNEVGPSPSVTPSTPSTPAPSGTPSATPSGPPTAKVADTLCVRIDQTLVRQTLAVPSVAMEPEDIPAEVGLPTYDDCGLQLGTATPGRTVPLRIGVSVLPGTAAGLATARQVYDARRGGLEASKPVTGGLGGFGTSRFAVRLGNGRLVKVSGPPATIQKYAALAAAAVREVPGLPEPEPLIVHQECERGSTEAADVLGAPAMIRRDVETKTGDLVCAWITTTGVLWSSEETVPDAVKAIQPIREKPTAESVPLGDEALFDTATRAVTIRVGTDKIVSLTPLPAGRADKNAMIAFALAVSGLYTR